MKQCYLRLQVYAFSLLEVVLFFLVVQFIGCPQSLAVETGLG